MKTRSLHGVCRTLSRLLRVWILAAVVLLMAGCDAMNTEPTPPQEESGFRVYYMNSDASELLSTAYALNSAGDAAVAELYQVLQKGQYNDGRPAVPDSVVLERSAWQENSLILYLSGSYPKVGTVKEILCRAALVCTMSQVDDVTGITIYVDNEPLKNVEGDEIGILTREQFLFDINSNSDEENTTVTLYFSNADGNSLIPKEVVLTVNGEISQEMQIINALIQGPDDSSCYRSLPQNTKVLSVTVQNKICYVNLDESFSVDNLPVKEHIAVYSIVNSLCSLSTVDSVQLLINGSADVQFGDSIQFSKPLEANLGYVERFRR